MFLGSATYVRPHPKGAGPKRPQNFWDPLYGQAEGPRATKFGMVTHVGHSVFLLCKPRFLRAGPQRHQHFWDPYLRHSGLTYSNEI